MLVVVLLSRREPVLVNRRGGGAKHLLHVLSDLRYYYTAAAVAQKMRDARSFLCKEGQDQLQGLMAVLILFGFFRGREGGEGR